MAPMNIKVVFTKPVVDTVTFPALGALNVVVEPFAVNVIDFGAGVGIFTGLSV